MRRALIRHVSVGTVIVAVFAAAATAAFAAAHDRGRGGGPGFGHHGGGGGILAADVLTPAADYLGVSLSTLQSDLKGGKTLAQEATAKGKTSSGLIDAIVAAEKKVLDAQ